MDINIPLLITLITILLILLVLFLVSSSSPKVDNGKKIEIYRQLEQIKRQLSIDNTFSNRDCLIRMDSILNQALKLRYKNSLTTADNLKLHKRHLTKERYELIWKYHKLRNSVVHENIDISYNDVKDAYKIYTSIITKLVS